MKIGLIGTNWGRIHCATFGRWGHRIDTILGADPEKTRRIAAEEGIAHAARDPRELEAMDIIVIASPHQTHASYIEMFRDKWILCEKPLAGTACGTESIGRIIPANLYVNYAFPFLETAAVIRDAVRQGIAGSVFGISLNIAVSFPFSYSDAEWFVSVASHELYFLNKLFSPFMMKSFHRDAKRLNVSAIFANGEQTLSLNLYRAHRESLMIDMAMTGEKGSIRVEGGYLPGRNWNFDPVTFNGDRLNEGEYSRGEDIWMRANAMLVKSFLDLYEGKIPREEAIGRGLADFTCASMIEKGTAPLLNS